MEITPTNVDASPKGAPMTDVDTAFQLIEDNFVGASGRDVKVALGVAFDALKRWEKGLPRDVLADRPRHWTPRRVRALWNREARRVDHYEIQDLTAVAVEEARIERQRLKAREDRLAAFLAAHQASADSQGRDDEGGPVGGLDLSGTGAEPRRRSTDLRP